MKLMEYQITDYKQGSWSDETGPYQYYIHGPGNMSEYLSTSEDYKNPAAGAVDLGLKLTVDYTSLWNNENILRTELILQKIAAINSRMVYYHFSIRHNTTNSPSADEENQVCFL